MDEIYAMDEIDSIDAMDEIDAIYALDETMFSQANLAVTNTGPELGKKMNNRNNGY